ncbi:MAG: aspartate aminotransferase family protein [Nitrososphaerota archaeon]
MIRDNEYARLIRFFPSRGIKIVRAQGQYVWDIDGKRYLDYHTGNGAAFLGHSNPVIVEMIIEQASKVMTCPPIFDSQVLDDCLAMLGKILPRRLKNVYFLNSGSEAVELALKLARKRTGRRRFASFTGAFHGRTMGALAMTHNPKYRAGYDPFPWEHIFLPFNDVSSLDKIDESFAAVIIEPVQGEGGLSVANKEFMKALADRCRNMGSILIIDEVQTGFGRTGRLWSHEEYDIDPDIMVAGKSIGGGFPVSIVAVNDEIASRVEEAEHGSTHGGNPLALAAVIGGTKVLLRDNVPLKSAEKGNHLSNGLSEIAKTYPSIVRGVKGKGLMIGLDIRFNPAEIIRLLQTRGLLALKAGSTVLRFLPPYLITEEDIDWSIRVIDEAVRLYCEHTGKRG